MKNVFFAACGIALSLGCGLANAQVLDPNAYSSNGALSLSSGTYTLDTDALTFAGNSGVLSNGIAVFDFSSVNIGTNATVNVVGSHPLALLSQGDATIGTGSSFNLNGGDGGYAGGSGSSQPGAYAGGGSGPGGGGTFSGGGGGGFGGAGRGNSFFAPYYAESSTYGNLLTKLEGGSGGGGGGSASGGGQGTFIAGGDGGHGGGAIEINALGHLTLAGDLNANGFGGGYGFQNGGGGAGGGVLLAGNQVTIANTGQVNANGGVGQFNSYIPNSGGGGGGGRITIQTLDSTGFSSSGLLSVNGGVSANYLINGEPGVITITVHGANTPAPGSLLVMAVGLAGGAAFRQRKTRRIV